MNITVILNIMCFRFFQFLLPVKVKGLFNVVLTFYINDTDFIAANLKVCKLEIFEKLKTHYDSFFRIYMLYYKINFIFCILKIFCQKTKFNNTLSYFDTCILIITLLYVYIYMLFALDK